MTNTGPGTATAPTMVSATLVEVVDDLRVKIEVVWEDNEAQDDEFSTNFTFRSADGSNTMTATAYASEYGPGTGTKTAVVIGPKLQGQVSATTWRWYTYPDGAKYSVGSPDSNAVPVDTTGSAPASPGKGQKAQGGKGSGKNA